MYVCMYYADQVSEVMQRANWSAETESDCKLAGGVKYGEVNGTSAPLLPVSLVAARSL